MKTATLVLAAALAATIAHMQPATAQTQDLTGAAAAGQAAPDDNGNATTGAGNSAERDDDNAAADGSGRADEGGSDRQLRDRAPMMMRMRPMMPQRQMMLRGAGARFHFARGNARMDVVCSPQEDTEACVRAAGELIDKLAELHGADRDNMTGSADRDERHSGTGAENGGDNQGALGERM